MVGVIAARELRVLFCSPLAWALLAVGQALLAWMFLLLVEDFLALQPRLVGITGAPGATDLIAAPLLQVAAWLLLALTPLLTMRTVSEERRTRTLIWLRSAPLASWQIVLGKYLSVCLFLLVLVLLTALMPLTLAFHTSLDGGKLAAGLLGLLLLAASFAAVGLYVSTLTTQSATAAGGTLGLLLLLTVIDAAANARGEVGGLFAHLSLLRHFEPLRGGLLDSTALSYFVLFSLFFLSLAVWRLESERGRQRWLGLLALLLFMTVIGTLGWLSTRHVWQADWTAGQRNTLSTTSQATLTALSGPVRITAFVRPDGTLRDTIAHLIGRYQREKFDITLEFVDPDRVPERVRELNITRDGELYLEYQGRGRLLAELTEQGLTNALLALSRAQTRTLGFLTGHDERRREGTAPADLKRFTEALAASGVRTVDLNLVADAAIPADIAVLIIASPRTPLLAGETAALADWLAQGGHLLWLAEPGADADPAGLAALLDVQPVPGLIVDADAGRLGLNEPTFVPVADYGLHPISADLHSATLFPTAVALEVQSLARWSAQPLLSTQPRTWTETGAISGTIAYDDPQERAGPLTLGVALSRLRENAPEQRAVVIGDGDFLSNVYLGHGGNLDLGLAIINWLVRDDALVTIRAASAPDQRLELSEAMIAALGAGFLGVLPLGLLASGGLIAWRRRRR